MTKQKYYELLLKATEDGIMPSINPVTKTCKYRFGDKKCAFGLLIKDDKYRPECESQACWIFSAESFIMPEGMNMTQLGTVQRTHDICARENSEEEFKHEFKRLLNNLYFFNECKQAAVSN